MLYPILCMSCNQFNTTFSLCFRLLPTTFGLLPGLDMSGCPILHSIDNASMHYQRGQIFVATVSDEVRKKQVETKSHVEDYLCVVVIYSHELTT